MINGKISVITVNAIKNYGTVLQTYATQEKLKSYDYDVEFVNFIRENCKVKIINNIKKNLKYRIHSLLRWHFIYIITCLKRRYIYTKFLKKYIKFTPNLYTYDKDFDKYPISADIYCTGSDQVWNSYYNGGILKPFFLSYAPDNKLKISYAASIGKSEFEPLEVEKTKELLSRYDGISVREKSAVTAIEKLGINGSVYILDPTLIMDKQFWFNFAGKRKIKEPYYLVYQLNENKELDMYVQRIEKEKNVKIYRVYSTFFRCYKRTGKIIIAPQVNDFVNVIAYADCVITDSFHGVAFSINLNRNFVSIFSDSFFIRISDLLEITGLEYKHLLSYDDFSVIDKKIDYEKVNNILETERKKANVFLDKYLR